MLSLFLEALFWTLCGFICRYVSNHSFATTHPSKQTHTRVHRTQKHQLKYALEKENSFDLFGHIDERNQRHLSWKSFTDSISTPFRAIVEPSSGVSTTPHKIVVRILSCGVDKCFYFLRKKDLILDQPAWFLCQDLNDLKYSTTVTLQANTISASSSTRRMKDINSQPSWANIPWPLHQFAQFHFESNGDIEVVIDISTSAADCLGFGLISLNDSDLAPTEVLVRCHGIVLFRFQQVSDI